MQEGVLNAPEALQGAGKALGDLRILDLTHYLAGPFCTKVLAHLGADVIKVERPGRGDGARHIGPFAGDEPHPEKSLTYLYLNTNKRGITLDLKSPTGRKIALDLATRADILVENFAPGTMAAFGLDYETLQDINPRLIVTSISNFGQTGPYRDYQASEIVLYAFGGPMYVLGTDEGGPLKHGLFSQAQYAGGINGALVTLLALAYRRQTGLGQQVDVSIAECLTSEIFRAIPYYAYTGAITRRQTPEGDSLAGGMGLIACQNGYLAPSEGMSRNNWDTLGALLQAPELEDPKYASVEGRTVLAKEIRSIIADRLRDREKYEVFHTALEWRHVWGVVQNPGEIARCPQLHAREFYQSLEHPVVGAVDYPGALFKMSESPWTFDRVAPTLGQHNEDVYCGELGFDRTDLVRLRERGVI